MQRIRTWAGSCYATAKAVTAQFWTPEFLGRFFLTVFSSKRSGGRRCLVEGCLGLPGIDYIVGSPSLKGTVEIAGNFLTGVLSDRKPIHYRTLAPKRDKRHRKRLMARYLKLSSRYPRLPANWTPQDCKNIPVRIAPYTVKPSKTLGAKPSKLPEIMPPTPSKIPQKTLLLKGLRKAQDSTVRKV